MQSSSEIHHHERCRPVFPTENIGPADSDKGKVRRRVLRKSSAPQICRQQSFGRDIGHAAAETYLITRLSFDLLGYLGYHQAYVRKKKGKGRLEEDDVERDVEILNEKGEPSESLRGFAVRAEE